MGLVEVQRQLGVLGSLTLDVRGDAAWVQLSADNGVETQTETVRTLRLGAGAKGQWQIGRLTLAPILATHLRHDRERGLETTLSLGQPGQLGPSLSLIARWGDAATGGDTLWREQLHYRHGTTRINAWSLDARSEVGLRLGLGAPTPAH